MNLAGRPSNQTSFIRRQVALNELDARPYRRVLKEAKRKRLVIQVVRLCQMSLFVGALAAHIGGLSVAMRSYPGGEALSALHRAHGLAQRTSGSLECPEPFVYIDPAFLDDRYLSVSGNSRMEVFIERASQLKECRLECLHPSGDGARLGPRIRAGVRCQGSLMASRCDILFFTSLSGSMYFGD
ncbi:hypothetical protein F1559_000230 [Cyanidiococcus yangmingshanensis]|uniref:Uncharacterized protein n=1 Tax=Cyanidiococcus yangmingshanensis TaxID=2690220 RepID=A0A7J7IIN6_9RHOD|nr:hypothetical protein F1559_000230 [Cyanidiococcus yangmingshanensis]